MHRAGEKATTMVMVIGDGEHVLGRVDARSPDVALVDLLLRLALAARRRGGTLRVRDSTEPLRALLELLGLTGALVLETGGQAEGGEQLGIDEVVQPADRPV